MEHIRLALVGMSLLLSCEVLLCQVCSDAKCELMQNLTHSYWKDILPECPGSGLPVDVEMQLLLRQVVDLDEPKQILTTNVWVRFEWNDCRLSWNPVDYDGIDHLYFPFGSIWTPDVTLYDDSSYGRNIGLSERKFYRLEVYSSGRVKQKFPTLLKTVCGVDTTYFPFDKQTCPLKFAPWVYDYNAVNMTTDEDGITSVYVENAEWELKVIQSENMVKIYSNDSFTEVNYQMLTLFFPCFLICTMALLGFFLPPSSEQKVGIQLTLFLSLTVFEFLTLGIIPPNSKPLPLMCVYFALVMVLASLSCVLSVVVMKIHLKGEEGWKVPSLARTLLVEKLGSLLCVKRPDLLQKHAEEDLISDASKSQAEGQQSTVSVTQLFNTVQDSSSTDADANESVKKAANKLSRLEGGTSTDLGVIIKSFQKVAESLSRLIEHMEEKKTHRESAEFQDWVTIASVLDRLFLILYILLSVIVFLVFIIHLTS